MSLMLFCYWLQTLDKVQLATTTLSSLTIGCTFWDRAFMTTAVNTDMVDNSLVWSYTQAKVLKVQLAILPTANTQETHHTPLLFPPELLRAPISTQRQRGKGLAHTTPCSHCWLSCSSDYKVRFNLVTKKKKVTFSFLHARVLIFHFSEQVHPCDRMNIKTGSRQMKGGGSQESGGIMTRMQDLSFLTLLSLCLHCVTKPTASLIHWGSSGNQA